MSLLEIVEVWFYNLQIGPVCCCIQMKSTGQKVSFLRHQKNCPVSLIFCIGMKWYKGLAWILLTMCARSLPANRGGGAGLS